MSPRKDRPFREQYAQIVSRVDPRLLGRAEELGYSQAQIQNVPRGAVEKGLGCGNPTALAELQEGQTVLDLGSGAGLDVFVAAQKVGSRGRVIGVDATPEMIRQAQQYAQEGRYDNVEFKVGRIEDLPLADQSVDVIISNCVINHSRDKPAAFKEALRVLRPGGKIHLADLVVEGPLPAADSPGLEIWASWLTVASGKQEYLAAIEAAGFREITIVAENRYEGPAMTPLLAGKIVSLLIQATSPSEEARKGAGK